MTTRSTTRKQAVPAASMETLLGREAPHNPNAEMALLGAMILDPKVIPEVIEILAGKEDFYSAAHVTIYAAMVTIYDRERELTLVQLEHALQEADVLDPVGGTQYLVVLANATASPATAPYHAKIVAALARKRRIIDGCGRILHAAYAPSALEGDETDLLDLAEQEMFAVSAEHRVQPAVKLADLLQVEMDRIRAADGDGGMTGLATGYSDLDNMLQGLQPGELIILAARPSMGKTALMLGLAEGVAFGGMPLTPGTGTVPVAVYSMEMGRASVIQRMLCARARVRSQGLRSGARLPAQDLEALATAAAELMPAPIHIDDTPNMAIMTLRAKARRMVMEHRVQAIFVDYLQLMAAPQQSRDGRQQEVSAISRGLKALARELNVPIVCLSQLNRQAEQREGNRPRMSDLRESGSIEQDADMVMLLHREEYYHKDEPGWREANPNKVGLAELIVAKQRNGPTGTVKLTWIGEHARFAGHDPHAVPPGDYAGDDLGSMFASIDAPKGGGGGGRGGGPGVAGGVAATGGGGVAADADPFQLE